VRQVVRDAERSGSTVAAIVAGLVTRHAFRIQAVPHEG
jgi:hypothetical protein